MQKTVAAAAAVVVLIGLYAANLYNYLLFHSIAEIFSIVIACGVFMVAWNTRRYNTSPYLLHIGIAYLFIAVIDFVHTLAFSGMNIFVGFDANAPTQLWIAARYLESLTLLAVPLLLKQRIKPVLFFVFYGAVTTFVLLSIFYWQTFPDCFLVDAGGLTPFKKNSEYVIVLILLGSAALFFRRRDHFDPGSMRWLLVSIGMTVLAELAFTTYASVYGFSNLLGHYFKIVSFYCMYKAVIETGLAKPYNLLFRDLNQQREWLRVTLESIGDAVIATDNDRRVTFLNKTAEELTGWKKAEAAGRLVREIFQIVHEHSREAVADPVDRVLESGMTVGLANHTLLLRKGGGEVPIDDSAAPICDQKGRMFGVVLVFRDISERRNNEDALREINENLELRVIERTQLAEGRAKQLQNLAVELIEAEERERRRLSELLHDDLQQILAAAKMQLQAVPGTQTQGSDLANVNRLLEESIKKTRSLSHALSPPVLYHSGLAAALQWLARQMQARFGLQVEHAVKTEHPIESMALKVFLFRAVQELLFNTVKHAGTLNARIEISTSGESFKILVSDHGKGFSPELLNSMVKPAGLGLLSLRERVHNIGGTLLIESAPGKGSRFTLAVPLSLTTQPDADAN
jgi:PAS domain S-box-containing protein